MRREGQRMSRQKAQGDLAVLQLWVFPKVSYDGASETRREPSTQPRAAPCVRGTFLAPAHPARKWVGGLCDDLGAHTANLMDEMRLDAYV